MVFVIPPYRHVAPNGALKRLLIWQLFDAAKKKL